MVKKRIAFTYYFIGHVRVVKRAKTHNIQNIKYE